MSTSIHFPILAGLLILSLLNSSCESEEAELIDYSIEAATSQIKIIDSSAVIHIYFHETVTAANDIVTNFQISEGATLAIDDIPQTSGESGINYERPFTFRIISGNEKNIQTWNVYAFNNSYTNDWGLGGFKSQHRSNDRPYTWYIDQGSTSPYSSMNCAPSSVVMACRWADESFPYTVTDARSLYHPEGGGWYTSDINNCLSDYHLRHDIIELGTSGEKTTQLIRDEIDKGNLLLVCIDIHYLQRCKDPDWHVDKYYQSIELGTGHCVVIKGYIIVDGELYFEVYDPVGYNYKYSDGQYKGKDRYYRSIDIFTATFGRWNYAFTIYPPGEGEKAAPASAGNEIPDLLIL